MISSTSNRPRLFTGHGASSIPGMDMAPDGSLDTDGSLDLAKIVWSDISEEIPRATVSCSIPTFLSNRFSFSRATPNRTESGFEGL